MTPKRRRSRRRGRVLAIAAVVVVVAVGAGAAFLLFGDDGDGQGPGSARHEKTAAGLALSTEVIAGQRLHGRAEPSYRLLSGKCRHNLTQREWAAQVLASVAAVKKAAGADPASLKVKDVKTREVRGDKGQAKINLANAKGKVVVEGGWEHFIYQGGAWRLNECGLESNKPAGKKQTGDTKAEGS